jgi:hypothetical protein
MCSEWVGREISDVLLPKSSLILSCNMGPKKRRKKKKKRRRKKEKNISSICILVANHAHKRSSAHARRGSEGEGFMAPNK